MKTPQDLQHGAHHGPSLVGPTGVGGTLIRISAALALLSAAVLGAGCTAEGELVNSTDDKSTQPFAESEQCTAVSTDDIDVRRSLAITDEAVLGGFSLERTLAQLVTIGEVTASAEDLFIELWDTQNDGRNAVGNGAHCDDETLADGTPAFNGFPWQCPRHEGDLVDADPFSPASEDHFFPIGLFARFDLAPASGEQCGEFRIIYGKRDSTPLLIQLDGRALIIFEAALPNPNPALGLDGCRPVAELWANLSDPQVSSERAREALEAFYYDGLPGFAPVVHPNHFGAIGGQIRTNQFLENRNPLGQLLDPTATRWQLREFKLARTCDGQGSCDMSVVPVTVKNNPWPGLFSEPTLEFAEYIVEQLPTLVSDDLNAISMADDDRFNAGQSDSQIILINGPLLGDETRLSNDYDIFLNQNGDFADIINNALSDLPEASGLDAEDIAERASAISCGGCHQHSNNSNLGQGLSWPPSLGFVHVSEVDGDQIAGAFDSSDRAWGISEALSDVFLPFRAKVLADLLNNTTCDAEAGATQARSQGKPAPLLSFPATVDRTSFPTLTGPRLGGNRGVH